MTDRLNLVFAGTPDFAVPALDALHAAGHVLRAVYTQPDRPAGRGQAMSGSPVKGEDVTFCPVTGSVWITVKSAQGT